MKHINENGRSMVEMLGVLAIIGVLSVGGIAGYSKAMNKYKINKTTDQVSMLVANIRTLFSSQGDYAGLSNGQAIKFGVVPNDMYTASSNNTYASNYDINNAFNGDVFIASADARGVDDNEAFIVSYNGLTAEACVTIATGDWGSGQGSGLIAIAAAGTNGTAAETGGAGSKLTAIYTTTTTGSAEAASAVSIPGSTDHPTPMSVTNAVNACNGSGSTNSVAWKYY